MLEQAGQCTLYIFGSLEIMCKTVTFYEMVSVYESLGSGEVESAVAGPNF